MLVTDLESRIDVQYDYKDIKELSSEGIKVKNDIIRFEDTKKYYYYTLRQGEVRGKEYVGDRNSITDPPYMRFIVYNRVIIILFPNKDVWFDFCQQIWQLGYELFNLS